MRETSLSTWNTIVCHYSYIVDFDCMDISVNVYEDKKKIAMTVYGKRESKMVKNNGECEMRLFFFYSKIPLKL